MSSGLDLVIKSLEKYSEDMEDAVIAGMAKAGEKLLDDARDLCPVVTGRLRDSISFRVENQDAGPVGILNAGMDYAPFVEFGTSMRHSRPFLYPAFKQNESYINKCIILALKDVANGKRPTKTTLPLVLKKSSSSTGRTHRLEAK